MEEIFSLNTIFFFFKLINYHDKAYTFGFGKPNLSA